MSKEQLKLIEAKETNKRVLIQEWTEDCNEPDCSLDKVYEWAMPDGTIRIERQHTF
jgi:hypothetical protein